ncbi:MAG: hypothetical protein U0559_16150 [Anaerolineae bacterium]
MSHKVWIIIGGVVVVYVVLLATDVVPWVRGPIEWQWARYPELRWDRAWPVGVAVLLVGLWVGWIDRRVHHTAQARRWLTIGLAGLIVAALSVQLLALRVDKANPFEALFDRAVDVAANSYFSASQQIVDVNDALRTYPALMPTFLIHAQVHPPGLPLIYWATAQVFDQWPAGARTISQWFRQMECNSLDLMMLSDARLASGLAGMMFPLVANVLTLLGVFKLAKDRFGVRAGWWAAALWASVPSAVLFPGSWSLVYPCLACFTWLAVDAGLRQRKVWWFGVAGGLLSIGTFLELGTAALSLFLVLYILAHYFLERRNVIGEWRFLVTALVVTLIGVFSIWAIYQAGWGVSLKQIVDAMYPIHTGYEFNRLAWIVNHPYEFAVFVGLPIFCLLVLVAARTLKLARSRQGDALSLSFVPGLIMLAIVDPARDETARTWMLFMPLAVVSVSQLFRAQPDRSSRLNGLWPLLAIQLTAMLAVLNVVQVGLYGLPARETLAALPNTATPIQADFGGMAKLIGYEVQPQADQLIVNWYWQGRGSIDYPYTVFNHLIDQGPMPVAQQDDRPQNSQPLMTCWQPGEIYRDQHIIALTPDTPLGPYRLEMGLYNAQTGARVLVTDVAGARTDHVEVGPILISK